MCIAAGLQLQGGLIDLGCLFDVLFSVRTRFAVLGISTAGWCGDAAWTTAVFVLPILFYRV